jgi:fimbrial chaperone protein
MDRVGHATARLCLAVAFCALSGIAAAASFSVDPLRIELTPAARGTAISVRNQDSVPVVVQIRVMTWGQPQGKDQLDATRDLLVTPGVVEIPAGATQVLRLGRRVAAELDGKEQTYRVLIREVLPEQPAKGGMALRMALEISVPVFVGDESLAPGALEWQARREPDAVLMVAHNAGGKRVKVTGAELFDAAGRSLGHWQGMTYLLAGATRNFRFKAPATLAVGSAVKLKLTTESGDAEIAAIVAGKGG